MEEKENDSVLKCWIKCWNWCMSVCFHHIFMQILVMKINLQKKKLFLKQN